MLRVVHGNRVEALLSALLEGLPAVDPFEPATIVVGSHLIARWLSREIALVRGIAAGLELPTFDRFVEQTWAGDAAAREVGLTALDRAQLGAVIASALDDTGVVRALPAVAAYLDAAPGAGDRAGPRRVQLAEHLAGLCWQYAICRPDWLPALFVGHCPAELAADATARWQAALIAAAFARLARAEPDRTYSLVPALPWARRRAGLAPPQRSPIAVFGVSFLQRAQLEALTDLAATTDVTVYLLDPCRELWDDVAGRGSSQGSDPLLLGLWGKPIRDTLGSLVERTGGDVDDRFVTPAHAVSARQRLLADLVARRVPNLGDDAIVKDAGVTVLACANVRREIEVIASDVRRRLDADPELRANEIVIWLASSQSEAYLAQAPAAFDAVGVPCHLIDAPIDDRGRIGEAVLALLELPTSAMARRDLLRVMTHPAVLARYQHVDAADWVRWTERLGIVHGATAESHQGTYLEDHRGRFHWDQGVRRLALGAFMAGDRADRGPVRFPAARAHALAGLEEIAPEEVRADQQPSAATYALLVRSLCADAAWLADLEAPLARWAEVFAGLVDAYLGTQDPEATRDLERVRKMLAGLAHLDLDGRVVGFREAREHAARRLTTARADRGEPLASGVTIAPLRSMRALPYRVVYVAGLDEGAFPAGEHTSPLDLRSEPRTGDVSPRDRDRYAFFEVLLGARDALLLSYVAVEAKSGQALGPSSVVLELADALAPYLGAASSRDALTAMTVRHPLHRFGGVLPASSTGVGGAIRRERWACAVRDALRDHLRAANQPVPDEDGLLALLAHSQSGLAALRAELGIVDAPPRPAVAPATRPLSIAVLRGFLEQPLQAWAQAVLGLGELPDESVIDHSDEPFELDSMRRATVLRDVLASQLTGGDPEACYDKITRDLELRGQFPVGVFAEAERAKDLRLLEVWRTALAGATAPTRYGFGRAWSPGAQLLPALELFIPSSAPASATGLAPPAVRLVGQTELIVERDGTLISVIAVTSKQVAKRHHLRGAFDHLLLAAAGLAPKKFAHVVMPSESRPVQIEHLPWTQTAAREYLGALASELHDQPHGYLLTFDQMWNTLAGKPLKRDRTGGLGFGPIERADGLDVPHDIHAIALRRLKPLSDHMPHLIEVAS